MVDYGLMIELFIHTLDRESQHKSFVVKIRNRLERAHKRNLKLCIISELKIRKAIKAAETRFKEPGVEISLGALIWLIHNRHKDILKPYGFDPKSFDQLNKFSNAQGVILQTSRVLNLIEEELNK